ncbi:MAG TPA: aldo/keto reductase [Rhodanobacteraceae bacterium]
MQTLRVGPHGDMPQLGLGTWKSSPGEVYGAVRDALRAGYRHIDCAYAYDNEAQVGRAVADGLAEGIRRDELWITSKLWNSFHHRRNVRRALETTLQHLRLDHLDLYLMHWPVALREGIGFPKSAADMLSLDVLPLAETWAGMEDCIDAGLVRHIGVSNFSADKLRTLAGTARIPPAVNQVELHPYLQQPELLAACRSLGVVVTAYSPLGSGDRDASMKAHGEPVLLDDPVIAAIAKAHAASPAQVLIAWALQRGTAVIPKTVNPEHLRQNLAALDLRLGDDDMAAIAKLDRHRRYVDGAFWALPGSGYTLANLWDE